MHVFDFYKLMLELLKSAKWKKAGHVELAIIGRI